MPRTTAMFDASFFDRPADRVARDLLGAQLAVRTADGGVVRHVVFETEAYLGAHDLACHGSRGLTRRNATMFGPAGRWYVYLCYGMHWMLNVVTGREGVPAAVLIRGVGGHVGPGRVTKALGIDRSIDGRPADRRVGLWLEAGVAVPRRLVVRTPRIGVAYAGAWAEKPLRFVVDPARLPAPDAVPHRMVPRQGPAPRPTGRRLGRRIGR
jgi:DNA-3-methyladenine glycosylase